MVSDTEGSQYLHIQGLGSPKRNWSPSSVVSYPRKLESLIRVVFIDVDGFVCQELRIWVKISDQRLYTDFARCVCEHCCEYILTCCIGGILNPQNSLLHSCSVL